VTIRILVLIVALTAVAGASTLVDLPKTKAQLEIPDGWQTTPAPGTVAAYRDERGSILAVTRADVPNPDAWKSETKHAYADEIELGLSARVPGYKRVAKKLTTANNIPVLDLEARREGGATLVVRVLLFRTYALALAIEVPKGGDLKAARSIALAFAIPKSD
jgi:hypothetical protein